MSVVEFIGFIITFVTMMVLFGKKAQDEKKRKRNPEAYERDQRAKKEALDKMYNLILDEQPKPVSYEEEPFEDEVDLPPIPSSKDETRHHPLQKRGKINKRDMVVLATIFGSPKTLNKG